LPPLLFGLDERGQAPLPDLFYFPKLYFLKKCAPSSEDGGALYRPDMVTACGTATTVDDSRCPD